VPGRRSFRPSHYSSPAQAEATRSLTNTRAPTHIHTQTHTHTHTQTHTHTASHTKERTCTSSNLPGCRSFWSSQGRKPEWAANPLPLLGKSSVWAWRWKQGEQTEFAHTDKSHFVKAGLVGASGSTSAPQFENLKTVEVQNSGSKLSSLTLEPPLWSSWIFGRDLN